MSAFEFYSKMKKNPIIKKTKKRNKNRVPNGIKSSTPLSEPNLFLPLSEVGPAVDNVFLSPIFKTKKDLNQKKLFPTVMEEKEELDNRSPEPATNGPSDRLEESKETKRKNKKHSKNKEKINISSSATVVLKNNKVNYSKEDKEFNNVFKEKKIGLKRKKRQQDGSIESPMPAKRLKSSESTLNSVDEGRRMLAWILSPVDVDDFFENYWEKRPLHISRKCTEYFDGICSSEDLDSAFRNCPIHLLKNVTVTSYKDGQRSTDQTPGRARPNAVWDMYKKGHSIRVLNPQTFIPNVGTIVATLQEYFRCMVGVNSYLTPAGTQGFAPHYDDIEAFVLQMEGEKDWKVYAPRSIEETLPRFSSPDFDQDEIGEPILEVTLKAGDLLYFPRGFIHQARSVETHHSLHLTVSSYQCNTWGDFFKTALPMALEQAMAQEVELREGLPIDFIDHLGVGNERTGSVQRTNIIERATKLFSKVIKHCPFDEAADQLGKEFIHSSFPPPHAELDKQIWKKLSKGCEKESIKLISANACRVTAVEDKLVVYYSTDNSLEPKGEELLGFEVTPEQAAVLDKLREFYPNYCKVRVLLDDEMLSQDAVNDLLYDLGSRALLKVKLPKHKSLN